MAPIYDTDVAEERWTADVWKTYELWEKVERRFKRKRRLWLGAAMVAFSLFSAIPVFQDALPKWQSLRAARVLAVAISEARLLASRDRKPIRLTVDRVNDEVVLRLERIGSCSAATGKLLTETQLFRPEHRGLFAFLSDDVARAQGIPGIVRTYCYDPFRGGAVAGDAGSLVGFALLPVNDLAESRFDRMSMVLIDPISGAVSID